MGALPSLGEDLEAPTFNIQNTPPSRAQYHQDVTATRKLAPFLTLLMLADPDAAFARAMGLEIDASSFGLGIRSQRYALVLQDGEVITFLPEENGLNILASTAACVLAEL